MKNTFYFLFALLTSCSVKLSQNKYSELKAEYEKTKTLFPTYFVSAFIEMEEEAEENGLVLFRTFKEDTLNLTELDIPRTDSSIEFISPTMEEQEIVNKELNWLFSSTYYTDDTLNIFITVPFGNEFINLYLSKGKFLKLEYREYYKNENVLKLKEADTWKDEYSIPAILNGLSLSNMNPKSGYIGYGHCSFETKPYYRKARFFEGDMLLKRKFDFYFKYKVK